MSTHYISKVNVSNEDYNFKDIYSRTQLPIVSQQVQDIITEIQQPKLGICADFENKTFTRIGDAENLSAGSDFDEFSMYGGRRRCNLADNGTVLAYYGDSNFKEDGSNGQVMVEQPKFYYKVELLKIEEQYNAETNPNALGYHIRKANYWISDYPLTGFKLHPAFINEDNEEVDYIYLSAYEGCIYDSSEEEYITDDSQIADFDNDLLCSIANVKPCSGKTQNLTRANCEKLAKKRGKGWHQLTVKIASMEQLLMAIEFCSFNHQSSLASGVVGISDSPNTTNNSSYTGSTSSLGNISGRAASTINERDGTEYTYTDANKTAFSYRGVENFYGNIWKFVDGVNIWGNGKMNGGMPYICTDFDFKESLNKSNYIGTGFTLSNGHNTDYYGYVSAFGYKDSNFDWLLMPSELEGTSALPIGDRSYITINLNAYCMAQLGGGWTNWTAAGSFCWALHGGPSIRYRGVGGRAVYIPVSNLENN